jgi:3'-5' exonuclease
MRKRVNPAAARWPSNGAAYPARDRSYIDSLTLLRTSHNRRLSNSLRARQVLQSVNNHHGGCSNSSNTTMSSPRTPSLAGFRQVLKTRAVGKRQFSALLPLRGGGFDDDDDFGSGGSDISSMVRRRANPVRKAAAEARRKKQEEEEKARLMMQRKSEEQAKMAEQAERRELIATILRSMEQELAPMLAEKRRYDKKYRLAREKRERAHKEWMRRYEEVVNRAASFNDIDERSFEEYYALKYPGAIRIESYLDEIPALVDYCKAELSNHRQSFRRINLASRRIDLDVRLARFAESLSSMAEGLSESVVTPQTVAKRNIDNLLDPFTRFQMHYTKSQNVGIMLQLGSTSIAQDLLVLAKETKRKILYRKLERKISENRMVVNSALHDYRTIRRLRLWFTPLGRSHLFETIVQTRHRDARQIMEDNMGKSPDRLLCDRSYLNVLWYACHWYLPRWDEHAPRSVHHNIDWRHLDVVYPFDLLYMTNRVIKLTAEELAWMLRRRQHPKWTAIENWHKRATLMNVNMRTDATSLKYCTFLRLRTESKVSSLGDVPDTVSRGLFTPLKPLSSDPRGFFIYIDTIRKCMISTERLSTAIAWLRNNKFSVNEMPIPPPIILGTISSAVKKVTRVVPPQPKSQTKISQAKTRKNRKRKARRKAIKEAVKEQSKSSISEPATLQSSSTSSSLIQSASIKKKGAGKPTSRRRGRTIGTEKITSGSTPSALPKIRLVEQKPLRSRTRSSKFAPISRRWYSTDSRAFLNDEQYEAAEADIASTDNNQSPTMAVEPENEDTIITTVSGTQVSEVISSHLSADESDASEPSNATFNRTSPQFWSYNQHKGPDGGNIIVHYCKTLDSAERVARLFSGSEVIGFDIEWKAQALSTSGIKSNVSLIQIANAERIALFHLAVFRPGNDVHELMPPALKELLESASTMKVGVSIKADCSRVRRHLGIEIRGQLELSHLYKLVRFSQTQPKMIDRRTVNLSQQVEEFLGLPLRKDNDVRRSDWTRPLDYNQVQCECFLSYTEFNKRKSILTYPFRRSFRCLCMPMSSSHTRRETESINPCPANASLCRAQSAYSSCRRE